MNVVFLSLMFSEKQLHNVYRYSKCGVQMAPHTFQSCVCRGLRAIDDVSLTVAACPPIGSFPMNYRRLLIPEEKNENGFSVGFVNLPKIKYKMQEKSLYRLLKPLMANGEPTVLLVYSLHLPLMRTAYRLKQEFPNSKVCLIQTDAVPGIDDMEKHMTEEAKARGEKLLQLSACCDGFVILTDYLKVPLQIGNRPYAVVEGIAAPAFSAETPSVRTDGNTFLYAGSLNTAYGIRELTEAFLQTDARFLICGEGDYKPELLDIIKNNPKQNIEYLGFLKPDTLAELRVSVDFLINPRRPCGTYTKYSFPSKTMEYLASGVPTVMYRLEGIPSEYDAYLNYLSGETPQKIAQELRLLCAADRVVLQEKAAQGKAFVLSKKNEYVQAKKIYALMHSLFE